MNEREIYKFEMIKHLFHKAMDDVVEYASGEAEKVRIINKQNEEFLKLKEQANYTKKMWDDYLEDVTSTEEVWDDLTNAINDLLNMILIEKKEND